jgi:lysyl-tRNA synthetase class 2
MEDVDDLVAARLRKLEALRELGVNPFPTHFERSHLSRSIQEQFGDLEGQTVRIAGRLVGAIRDMGGSGFAHVQDAGGRIQVFFRKNTLGDEGFALYKLLDVGDFIGVEGKPMRTRTGEVTVEATELYFLSKAIRPLPEKWHGLTDVETRFRQRYLDLVANPETRETFLARARIVAAVRAFLAERDYVEVETPVLQPIPGGGAARPFAAESNALGTTLYLRIALELYLKRCIAGGIERVYEIGKNFRNEGTDFKHNPEFTMIELYEAYADYEDMMALTEGMVSSVAETVTGGTERPWGDTTIDFRTPWRRVPLRQAIAEHAGIDYADYPDDDELRTAAIDRGLPVEPTWNRGKVLDELLTAFVEPKLIQPTFLIDYPTVFPGSTLAKGRPDDPDHVERFEAFAGGMEFANSFSELNDPMVQRARFEEQVLARQLGDQEAHPFDADFLRAMEHGMPPMGGLGVGIDRLVMLLTNHPSIREVILFPQLRPRQPR